MNWGKNSSVQSINMAKAMEFRCRVMDVPVNSSLEDDFERDTDPFIAIEGEC